jgi:hypothetical protein
MGGVLGGQRVAVLAMGVHDRIFNVLRALRKLNSALPIYSI